MRHNKKKKFKSFFGPAKRESVADMVVDANIITDGQGQRCDSYFKKWFSLDMIIYRDN